MIRRENAAEYGVRDEEERWRVLMFFMIAPRAFMMIRAIDTMMR